MDLQEVHKIVGSIKSAIFKNSNSFSIGMLKSHFRGSGLQFREHRVYGHGDDVRFIDWKMLAKTSQPYIKTFEEERNLEIVVVIDASPSMLTGINGKSKLQASIEICCLLMLLAKETNDYVTPIVFADRVIDFPKKAGEEGIAYLVLKLEEIGLLNNKGKVNIGFEYNDVPTQKEKQKSIFGHLRRRKEVVFLSDYNDFLDKDIMNRVVARSNVHLFKMVGPLDELKKQPFYMFGHRGVGKKGKFFSIKSKENESLENSFGKRMKKLKLADRYLEAFIKEML